MRYELYARQIDSGWCYFGTCDGDTLEKEVAHLGEVWYLVAVYDVDVSLSEPIDMYCDGVNIKDLVKV